MAPEQSSGDLAVPRLPSSNSLYHSEQLLALATHLPGTFIERRASYKSLPTYRVTPASTYRGASGSTRCCELAPLKILGDIACNEG